MVRWKGDEIDRASLGQRWTGFSPREAPPATLSNHLCQPSARATAATVCVITALGSFPQTHTHVQKHTLISPAARCLLGLSTVSCAHMCMRACVCVRDHTRGDKTQTKPNGIMTTEAYERKNDKRCQDVKTPDIDTIINTWR